MSYQDYARATYVTTPDDYAFADIGGVGIQVGTSQLVSNSDRQTLFNFDRDAGGTLFSSYMDRTYTNVAGEEISVVPLMLQIANAQTEEVRATMINKLMDELRGEVDENGNVISGADWYEEFEQAVLDHEAAISGGGFGGPTTQQQIETVFATVRDRALQMGLSYTDDELVDVATLAVNSNWGDAQVVDKLLTNYKFGEITDGTITDIRDQIVGVHKQFLLDIDPNEAMKMAKRVALGELAVDGVLSATKRQAKAQYSWSEPFLDEGMTLLEAIAPQRTAMASELELDAQEIDLNDSSYFDALFETDDAGKQRLATSTEIRRKARELPQWQQTDNARTLMSQLSASVGSIFGRAGF